MAGKPEDIPQDVWDAAEGTLDTMLSNHGYDGWRADSIGTIALAIMAETDRCSRIATGFVRYNVTDHGTGANPYASAISIAAAIRKRGEA